MSRKTLGSYISHTRKLIALGVVILLVHVVSAQRTTQLFNDDWRFYKGDIAEAKDAGFNDAGWRKIDLPHDWSIEGPFNEQWASATAYLPAGIGWYRKTFTVPPSLRSKNTFLYFDGVYKNSEVWINGHYLGKRPNGFIPFQYEITKYLKAARTNVIAVKVDHTQSADSRWYTGSGIYRNVYLIATNAVHVDQWGVQFTTPQVSAKAATANIVVTIFNQSAQATPVVAKAQLVDAKGNVVATSQRQISVAAAGKMDAAMSFTITAPSLWSIENPALYKLHVTLATAGKQVDDLTQNVGLRSFYFDKDKGFFLNGKSMKLKGVCIHDDAGALGVAVPEEVWARRLKILKEGGTNSLRLSHNPHADYLYDLADRAGFLVMDEAFDEWEEGKNKWIKGWNAGTPGHDGYHSDFAAWAVKDVEDMVMRSRNHPSIFLWSIGNEIDYPNDPYTHEVLNTGRNPQIYGKGFTAGHPPASRLTELATALVAAVNKFDTTRPVTAALAGVVMSNEVGYPETLDIVGYNYQEYRYPDDHAKYPGRVIYGSENGMAYSAWKAVEDNDYIAGQYLWTGIDYLGEARTWPSRSNSAGLLDLAGFPRPEYYFRQSLWTSTPMIYIATSSSANSNNKRGLAASWNYKNGDSVRISCFTTCDAAELFLNGKSSGKKMMSDAVDKVITWDLVYAPGMLLVNGYNHGTEATRCSLQTAGTAYAIKAHTERASFDAGKKGVAHIEMMIVDKNGILVPAGDNEITVTVEGRATLLGMESGSAVSHEDYKSAKRKAFNGRLLAYVQSGAKSGAVKVTLSSPGLQSQVIEFK